MASVSEVKARLGAALQTLDEGEQSLLDTQEKLDSAVEQLAKALEESEHEAANEALGFTVSAVEAVRECLETLKQAEEEIEHYMAVI